MKNLPSSWRARIDKMPVYQSLFPHIVIEKWSVLDHAWERRDRPDFVLDRQKLAAREAHFLEQAGVLIGASRHIFDEDRSGLSISVMSMEAIDTSQIEGETLDRASVQYSIHRALRLKATPTSERPAESGIAEMMVDLLMTTGDPLSEGMLHRWHLKMLNAAAT